MSTKIYDAYRIKDRHLGALMRALQQYKTENYQNKLRGVIWALDELGVSDIREYRKEIHRREKMTRFYTICVELEVSIWQHTDGFVYLKAFGNDVVMQEINNYLQQTLGKRLQEYDYWNNSDQPDGITDKQWAERERTWDKVLSLGEDTFRHFMKIEIFPDFVEDDYALPFWVKKGGLQLAKEQCPDYLRRMIQYYGLGGTLYRIPPTVEEAEGGASKADTDSPVVE